MKKVSIIVPIFNCEKYINRCIESLLAQTYDNIEILLINDGSTDSTEKICKEAMEKNNKIKYIYKENGGVSSARNVGIRNATGEFVMFVDSDDTIRPNTISDMIKYADDYDVIIGNYEKITNKGVVPNVVENRSKELTFYEFITVNYLWEVCMKLIRKNIIKKEFDETIAIGEDSLFWLDNKDNYKYIYIDKIYYSYYDVETSAMNSQVVNNKNITTFKSLERLIEENEGIANRFYKNEYIVYFHTYKTTYKDPNKIFSKNEHIYFENAKKYYKELMNDKNFKLTSKIRIFLQLKMPHIAKIALSLKK